MSAVVLAAVFETEESAMAFAREGAGQLLGVTVVRNRPSAACCYCRDGTCVQLIQTYGPSAESPDGFDVVVHDQVG